MINTYPLHIFVGCSACLPLRKRWNKRTGGREFNHLTHFRGPHLRWKFSMMSGASRSNEQRAMLDDVIPEEAPPEVRQSRGKCYRLLHRHSFDNEELEVLYQSYTARIKQASMSNMLLLFIFLTATLGVLNFVYVHHVTVDNMYHLSMCGVFTILFIYINTKYMQESHLPVICYIAIFLCILFAVVSLPVDFGDRPDILYSPAEGVWEITLVIFMIYAMLPLRIYAAAIIGVLLPVGQITISLLLANNFPWLLWRQVGDAICLFRFAITNHRHYWHRNPVLD